MTLQRQLETLWIVVRVESGIPTCVQAYRNQRSAERREQLWRQEMNLEDDETGLFPVRV